MAGYMYLGSQRVCPAVVSGSGSENIPQTVENGNYKGIAITEFKLPDDAVNVAATESSLLRGAFAFDGSYDYGPTWLKSINLNNLKTINADYCFQEMCWYSSVLTDFSAPNLETIDAAGAFYRVCFANTALETFSFPKLKTIKKDSVLKSALYYCEKLTSLTFESLEFLGEPTDYGIMDTLCVACTSLQTVSFPALKYVYSDCALQFAFRACTGLKDIYFNSIQTNSFGEVTSQFSGFLWQSSNVTLHFPSNVSAAVSALEDYPDFGGTNITILYDLPATE